MAPTHLSFYEIDLDDTWSCGCGTSFRVGDGMELFDDLYDVHCPGCGAMVLIVTLPTPNETRAAAAAGNARAIADLPTAERVERRWKRVAELALRSADQLPDLDGGPPVIDFDLVEEPEPDGDTERWFVLRHGEREIWRELALWEGAPRYSKLKELLEQRYGDELELNVSPAASFYLLGDKLRELPG